MNKVQALVNLSINELVTESIARGEGELCANGALVVKTGTRTGRSPKDRFIVQDEVTRSTVDWNQINQPITQERFQALWEKAYAYLLNKDRYYISQLRVGADANLGLNVEVLTELAWHALFVKNLFIREFDHTAKDATWTILNVANFKTQPTVDGVNSDAALIINFSEKKILLCGAHYAGEMKKAMFSVLNFLLPAKEVLPMHCAANANEAGETALFFGLSGTGKTTLSADPNRLLIGDDEHGWSKDGVFNFEGGCYAKCIDLSQEKEPLIWDAIRHGTVIENVVIDPISKAPLYDDRSLTENTRAAYLREYIPNRVETNQGGNPNAVIFLTCDLYGVLPPVAKLNKEQAAYYFLSGYTALVGSTEVNSGSGIKPTFSTCFGAPFFPRPPIEYAKLLMQRLEHTGAQVYLVNTGWTGGAYGKGGKRFAIPTTRAIISAILSGAIKTSNDSILPGFNFAIPTALPDIDAKLLDPRHAWANAADYQQHANQLIQEFNNNFQRFKVSAEIAAAAPCLISN